MQGFKGMFAQVDQGESHNKMISQTARKVSGAKSKTNVQERKKQLEEFRKKQVEAQRRALQIVEHILDNPVQEKWLVSNCQYICQADYEDAIIERSFQMQCGYPLCTKRIPKISTQKYHICSKTNKVFDISERKYFCSNKCYKASCYLKTQIPTSPLWLRDAEEEPPNITLLPLNNENRGSPGEEISFAVIDIDPELRPNHVSQNEMNNKISKVSRNNSLSLEKTDPGIHEESENNYISYNSRNLSEAQYHTKENETNEASVFNINNLKKNTESVTTDQQTECGNANDKDEPMFSTTVKDLQTYQDSQTSNFRSHKMQKRQPSNSEHPVEVVVRVLREWITPDTLKELFGSDKFETSLKEILGSDQGNAQMNFYYDQKKIEKMKLEYIQLCRKLDAKEAMDEQLDAALLTETAEETVVAGKQHNAVENLDEKVFEEKLSAFFQGKINLSEIKIKERNSSEPVKKPTSQFSTKCASNPHRRKGKHSKVKKNDSTESTRDIALPPVDSISQDTLRRQIVLDRIKLISQDILSPIGLYYKDISTDLYEMVATFRLSPLTVTFKPVEWMLLAVFLLKMLENKSRKLKEAFGQKSSRSLLENLLHKVQISSLQLDSLLSSILDYHVVLKVAFSTGT